MSVTFEPESKRGRWSRVDQFVCTGRDGMEEIQSIAEGIAVATARAGLRARPYKFMTKGPRLAGLTPYLLIRKRLKLLESLPLRTRPRLVRAQRLPG